MFETIELLSVLDELPTHILNHLRQPLLKRVCDNVNDLPELTAMENNLLINE